MGNQTIDCWSLEIRREEIALILIAQDEEVEVAEFVLDHPMKTWKLESAKDNTGCPNAGEVSAKCIN